METMEYKENLFEETLNAIATNALANKVASYYGEFFKNTQENNKPTYERILDFTYFVTTRKTKEFLEDFSTQLKIKSFQKLSFEVAEFSTYKARFCIENKCDFIYEKLEKYSFQATNDHIKELGLNAFISVNYEKEKTEEKSYLIVTVKNVEDPLTFPIILNEIMHFFKHDIQNRLDRLFKKIESKFNKEDISVITYLIYLLSEKNSFSEFYTKNKDTPIIQNLIKDQSKWLTLS